MSAFAGDSLTLVCSYAGYPTPVSAWCKLDENGVCEEGNELSCSNWTTRTVAQSVGQADRIELHIPALRDCDNGQYYCNVSNFLLPDGVGKTVRLNVTCK